MKRHLIIALVLMLVFIAIAAVFSRMFMRVNSKATDETFGTAFSLVLKDYEGNDVHLYEFRRKVLIAYAWASWCPYCADEIHNLAAMKSTYGDNVDILAINRAEPLSVAKAYTDQLQNVSGLHFLIDPEDEFFKTIGGYAMPETVFIDTDGSILFHQRGPIQLPEVEAKIKELLR